MYQLSIFCLLPLVGLLSVSEQLDNNGIGYFGTSNVRYQKTYLPPLIFSGNTQSSPISTTTDNPPSTTKTAPATADLPKINQINVTTSSGPIYIPRRKPFILPRRSKQGFGPKQQAVHASIVDELQPNLFLEKQTPKVVAPQPSFISVSQHSKVSAPQLVMQVISGPQTPTNTTLDASTVEMYVPNAIVNPTLTRVPALQVPFVTVSGPNASLVAVQPEKESVSFDLMTDNILEKEPMSPPQADPILQIKSKLNPASPQEQDLQLKTESFLSSTTNLSKSNNISYPIKLRPQITFVPVLDSVTMEEPDTTIPRFFNISDDNQGSTTETPKKVEPVAATIESLSIGTNLSSVNTITFLPITNTTAQTPIVKEIQPPLVTVPKLPLTETETQVITAPLVVIQLITDPQQPLNSVSDIYQPDVTSIQLNRTADIQFSTPFLSVLNTPTSVISFLPKTEPALNVPNPEIKVESKLVPQLDLLRPTQPDPEQTTQIEPEHTTLSKIESPTQSTFLSKENSHTPHTVSLTVMMQPKTGENIKEHTTASPLRGDEISESSLSFETPASATSQTLVTAKSQLMELSPIQTSIITSQPTIMSTSPTSEATPTLSESVVIPYNLSQTVIQLMPPQPSLSVAPQVPVTSISKSLAVIASISSVPEAQQKTDHPELFSVSEVTDSKFELSTPQEFKQDVRLNSESAFDLKSESTIKPEVKISNMPYIDPVKLRPQVGFVTIPDSEWKYVSLKSEPAVLPPLLPRPIPVREPAYGRHYFIQYPITSSTNNVSKVTLITKPTLAPFISSKPYNFWKTSEPEPATQSESTVQPEPEHNTQLEHTTLSKSESTTQSKPNLHTSKTVSLAVMIQPKIGEYIKEHTSVPPLRDDDISKSSFSFETPASAVNQTLVTTKSQLMELSSLQTPTVTSQPAIMTTSPMPEATTTLPESVVIPNNQSQTVIIQLIMPPQPSLSVAPHLPLAFTTSMSSVPEAQPKTDEHELSSVSKVTDSKLELSTPQELKQDAQLNSESTPDFKSESTFKPEVATSSMPYTDPGKLRPQAGFVTVPDSEWKYVSLKTEPAVEPTLLTRPIPVSLPSYGRHYFIQNPITSSTNNVSKVTLITKPTLAPFISSKPYNFWKTSEPEPSTQSESTVQPEPEHNTQLEPEHTTLPKSETTTQSKLNLHTSKTVPLAVMIQPKIGEYIKEHTTVPPLRDDDISKSSFSFETPASAANQTLVTTKSQLMELSSLQTPTVTSQPAIMTTSPMPEATTTLPESVVIPNNQSQTVIIQLIMPPQPSLSVAPQIPLAFTTSMSSVPEAQPKTDEHELFSVSKVTDSKLELSTPQELKQDAQLNSEPTPDFKSESTFKPEVATPGKPYTDPGKLRPQAGFVTVPDSEWNYVSLKTEPAVVPPLLPSPIPVREPAYGHHYFIQYPITSSTNHVSKVTPITKPTVASFISTKLYNGWQTTEPEPTTQSESTVQPEPEHNTQLEPEHTTLPKSETTTQSKLNLHISKTVPLAVTLQPEIGEQIKEHTTVPPLRDDDISESSFSFETSASATNQTLVTAKSQLIELSSLQTPTVTSQPAIMTTTLMPEATTTLPESVGIPNYQSQTVITQLIMPPQPSLSVAPQVPVTPISKPLAFIESMSSAPKAQQKTDHPELFSVSEVTDSKLELSALQEFKQDVRLISKSAPVLKSESTIKPEVEISTKFYIYPAKLIPKMGSVMVPGSEWKYVSLKQQPASFPSLLPKPNLVREPAYNRHYNTQYPITLSTSYVPTVTPSIKPTPAPFIYTKPYTMWQLNYGRYNPSTTATPIIEMTRNTTEVPSNNVFTSKRPDSFNLDFVCKEGNGYYAVENECDAYILCQKNKAVKYSCPDGLYFNPAAKYHEYPCTYPSEVQCTNSTGKQNTTHTLTASRQCPKQYGLFSMNDGDCSKYIMCNIGVATVMNCPAGLVFNPSTESCDWVANVPQCSPQVFKNYTCPDPPMDEYGVATDIIYKYKYRNQCTQYIACQRGYPRLLSCEGGLAFDEESQSCISYVYVKGCASYAV